MSEPGGSGERGTKTSTGRETNQRVGGGDGTGGAGGLMEGDETGSEEGVKDEGEGQKSCSNRRIPTVLVTGCLDLHFLLLIFLFWRIKTAAPVAPVGSRCCSALAVWPGFFQWPLLGFGFFLCFCSEQNLSNSNFNFKLNHVTLRHPIIAHANIPFSPPTVAATRLC